jgi:hypothetical protein
VILDSDDLERPEWMNGERVRLGAGNSPARSRHEAAGFGASADRPPHCASKCDAVMHQIRGERMNSSRKQLLKREVWRPTERNVWRTRPRWRDVWTIKWAELGRRLRARRLPAEAAAAGGPPAERPTGKCRQSPLRCAAYLAAALAFASAAVSLFWTLGGTLLLDTVGGSIENLARTRSASALLLGGGAAVAKVLAGLLALALVRSWGTRIRARTLIAANGLASFILLVWGAANVLTGGLVLSGVISPSNHPDERALRWHVFVWDLWFVVWGAALALALWGYRHARCWSDGRESRSRSKGAERWPKIRAGIQACRHGDRAAWP